MTGIVIGCAAVAWLLDRATKGLAVRRLADGERRVMHGVGLVRTTNRRGAIVSLPPHFALGVWLAVAALLVLALGIGPGASGVRAAGVGLVLGGAAGNLADRLSRGGVVDFISVVWWPAFNVADAAMVAGTAFVVGSVL